MGHHIINTVRLDKCFRLRFTSADICLANTLLSIDLSRNWTNASVIMQSTTKPSGLPSLDNPSLWYHEEEDILYTGFTGWNSSFGDQPALPPLSLWSFKPDGSGSGAFHEVINSSSSVWGSLIRPSSPLMAYGADHAWVLGGSALGCDLGFTLPVIAGMVQFDMKSLSFTNSSASTYNASSGLYKGAMQYVPTFGPEGLFIAMGGASHVNPVNTQFIDFGTVSIFDPAKQEWFNQTTTGSQPTARIDFCTAGINSTNGTYEM